MDQEDKWLIQQQPLLQTLNRDDWTLLTPFLQKIEFQPNEYIFREKDTQTDLYFILDGQVEVLKKDAQDHEVIISVLGKGNVFGDLSFLDEQPRSTSIRAAQTSQIYKLPKAIFIQSSHLSSIYYKILEGITKINLNRIRQTNQNYINSLKEQIQQVDFQNRFGTLFVILLILYSIQNLFGLFLHNYFDLKGTFLNDVFLLMICISIIFFIKIYGYSFAMFGITTKHVRAALLEVLGITIIAITIAFILYYLLDISSESFFTRLWQMSFPKSMEGFLQIIGYVFLVEFIKRGSIQTLLQIFLDDKQGLKAILVTSVLLGFLNSWPLLPAIISLCVNVLLGCFYIRYPTLLGVATLHIFITLLTGYH